MLLQNGTADVLQTAPVTLSSPRATLRFDIAYRAQLGAVYPDSLAVDVRAFCSGQWLGRVYVKGAYSGLGTVTPVLNLAVAYTPQSAADWRTEAVDLTPFLGQEVVVQFVGYSAWGNDLYLDNVTLNNGPLGVEALAEPVAELTVWPNPVAAGAPLHVALPAAGPATVRLLDALGRPVWVSDSPLAPDQLLTLTAPRVPGLYIVQTTPAWISRAPGASQAGGQQRVQVVPAACQTRRVVVR